MNRAAIVAALALALPAARSDPLAGRIAGKPQECVQLSLLEGPEIVDNHTILYRQSGRRTWKTQPIGPCPALEPLTTLITEVYGGQLCRHDRFRVKEPGMIIPSAYCQFSDFTPYDLPPKGQRAR